MKRGPNLFQQGLALYQYLDIAFAVKSSECFTINEVPVSTTPRPFAVPSIISFVVFPSSGSKSPLAIIFVFPLSEAVTLSPVWALVAEPSEFSLTSPSPFAPRIIPAAAICLYPAT